MSLEILLVTAIYIEHYCTKIIDTILVLFFNISLLINCSSREKRGKRNSIQRNNPTDRPSDNNGE